MLGLETKILHCLHVETILIDALYDYNTSIISCILCVYGNEHVVVKFVT